jgi:hypothetical protein
MRSSVRSSVRRLHSAQKVKKPGVRGYTGGTQAWSDQNREESAYQKRD